MPHSAVKHPLIGGSSGKYEAEFPLTTSTHDKGVVHTLGPCP